MMSSRRNSPSGCARMRERSCPNTTRAPRSSRRRSISYGRGLRGTGKRERTNNKELKTNRSAFVFLYFVLCSFLHSQRFRVGGRDLHGLRLRIDEEAQRITRGRAGGAAARRH